MRALVLFLSLLATSASAGTHKLTSATDTSSDVVAPCPGNAPTSVKAVSITSASVAGGQDATSISVTLGGTVEASDVYLVSVQYGDASVNYTAPPQVGSPFSIDLPDTQRGGLLWSVYVYVYDTAAGKTFNLTVNSITGTNNAYLPISTATRNISTPTCE